MRNCYKQNIVILIQNKKNFKIPMFFLILFNNFYIFCMAFSQDLKKPETDVGRDNAREQLPQNSSLNASRIRAGKSNFFLAIWKKAVTASQNVNMAIHLAEKIHTNLAKPGLSSAEIGASYAVLAYLHLHIPATKFAAPAFLAKARAEWPDLLQQPELKEIWQRFTVSFAGLGTLEEVVLSKVAANIDGFSIKDAGNNDNFKYYSAISLIDLNRRPDAFARLAGISIKSVHYRRAKFLEGILQVEIGRIDEARKAFQVVVSLDLTVAEQNASLTEESIRRVRELAVLNLARLGYEEGEFAESITYYRTLMQESLFFRESLAEQGWAFFMAGYPNRGLGAAYAATSPFFADSFNPDTYLLKSIIHYWQCDFDNAKTMLQQFIAHARREGELLTRRTKMWSTLADESHLLRYSKLYEDIAAGVSAENLGIGEKTLSVTKSGTASQETYKLLLKVSQARINVTNLSLTPSAINRLEKAIMGLERDVRLSLGRKTRATIENLSKDFDSAISQARLIYLEILTAKKDMALGGNRSVQNSDLAIQNRPFEDEINVAEAQRWEQDKNEFWYDELGNYVFQLRSKCR